MFILIYSEQMKSGSCENWKTRLLIYTTSGLFVDLWYISTYLTTYKLYTTLLLVIIIRN